MPVISTEAKRSGKTRGLLNGLVILSVLLSASTISYAQQRTPKPMSANKAQQFASAAIAPKLKRLPGFGLEPPQRNGGLYVFNATWEGLPNGSVNVGFYAVDPITGTVWNAVMECDQISTPELRSLQRRRRNQLGLSAAKLKHFEAKGPQCS